MTYPRIEDDLEIGHEADVDSLERNVRRQLNGRVFDFRLLAEVDGLILQGYTYTFHSKQLAQHAIMKATQLPILANEIEVGALEFAEG